MSNLLRFFYSIWVTISPGSATTNSYPLNHLRGIILFIYRKPVTPKTDFIFIAKFLLQKLASKITNAGPNPYSSRVIFYRINIVDRFFIKDGVKKSAFSNFRRLIFLVEHDSIRRLLNFSI